MFPAFVQLPQRLDIRLMRIAGGGMRSDGASSRHRRRRVWKMSFACFLYQSSRSRFTWDRVMTVCRSDVQVAARQFHRLRCSALDFQPVLAAQIQVRLAADVALLVRQGMKLLEVSALSGDPRRPLLHAGKHVRKATISRGEHRHTAVRVNADGKPPSLTHLQHKRDRLTSELR